MGLPCLQHLSQDLQGLKGIPHSNGIGQLKYRPRLHLRDHLLHIAELDDGLFPNIGHDFLNLVVELSKAISHHILEIFRRLPGHSLSMGLGLPLDPADQFPGKKGPHLDHRSHLPYPGKVLLPRPTPFPPKDKACGGRRLFHICQELVDVMGRKAIRFLYQDKPPRVQQGYGARGINDSRWWNLTS